LRCGVAVLAVELALVAQMLLVPWFGGDPDATPFIMLFGAVVVAAWFGGLWPGLIATALSALASGYFFLFPQHTLQISSLGQALRLSVFVLEGMFISTLVGRMHSARQRAVENMLRASKNERSLRQSEERYQSFIEQSTEGIWRFELEEPVAVNLSEDAQIERFYRHTYLAECNYAMARMYGFSRPEEIVGARLGDFLPRSVPGTSSTLGLLSDPAIG
jgi:K+-sensing histidine kinase KdpD